MFMVNKDYQNTEDSSGVLERKTYNVQTVLDQYNISGLSFE